MQTQSKITQFIFSEIGLAGRRKVRNITLLTPSEIAAIPAGVRTTDAPGGSACLPECSMPVADALAAGHSVRDIVSAIKETGKANGNAPSIHVSRDRKLTSEELTKTRKRYISEEVADKYAHPDQIWSCPVDYSDIQPTDTIYVHYPNVG